MDSFWKDKKIAAYIALKHHTRFIIPVMENIIKKGAEVEYIVAQAERSQEITAIETNLEYIHVFDFLKKSDTPEIYKNYNILRKNFAAALLKDNIFNLQMTTVMDKTLFATAQEYIAFKNYIEKKKPDLCIVLHELNRWGKIFSFHAKKNSIPMISFQEGLYTTATAYYNFNMTGHAQYSTLNLVWGQKSKEKLSGFEAPEEKIIPAGNTHITSEINRINSSNIRSKTRKKLNCKNSFAVLLLFSTEIKPVEEFLPLFDMVNNKKKYHLFIKFHPAVTKITIDNWLKTIPEKDNSRFHFIHGEENTYDLMAASDLCVLTEASTTGLEALAMDKPLIELSFTTPVKFDFSFAAENAAIKMTPAELAGTIEKGTDFNELMNQEGKKNYLKGELYESEKSIKTVVKILQASIESNHAGNPQELSFQGESDMEWSIVLLVGDNPETFITLLEAVSNHSEGQEYEVILIQPENIADPIKKILKSLEGDVSVIVMKNSSNPAEMFNLAAIHARGKNLVFMNKNIAPKKEWLKKLEQGFLKFGNKKIFGGKIINRFNNIVHAGMVVDANNCPVSAYMHLDGDFPHACKTRSFPMLDYFMGIEKQFFLSNGGFDQKTGKYQFLDFCLRVQKLIMDSNAVIYLKDLELVQSESAIQNSTHDDAIFFYSKWHGALWENEKDLYQKDGVSDLQLNAARMTRAVETASLK